MYIESGRASFISTEISSVVPGAFTGALRTRVYRCVAFSRAYLLVAGAIMIVA